MESDAGILSAAGFCVPGKFLCLHPKNSFAGRIENPGFFRAKAIDLSAISPCHFKIRLFFVNALIVRIVCVSL